jgi:uncharacterized protein (TIGR04255 family)
MSASTLPSYEAPPVIEVVLGLTFETLSLVKFPHIGLFWDTIRSEFPNCQQAPTLGNINSVIEPESGVPLPRVWLINQEDDNLIQLQKNKFLFNWRKRASSYPRFEPVSTKFFKYLFSFKQFLEENDLGLIRPSECELTYINHIPKGTGWEAPADVGFVLPDVCWQRRKERFLPDPGALNWNVSFALPKDVGTLFVKLNSAIRIPDNMPLLILELTVKRSVPDEPDDKIKAWYATAREWIVRGFEDLTSEKVQMEHWRKI